MGMAASQARLLTLTARIHDVEYEAQALQNAKLQLSTQSDYVYQDYLEALDATTLTVKQMDSSGNTSLVSATFNNLCSINKVKTSNSKSYALFDNRGRLIVDDDVYKAYQEFKSSELLSSEHNNAISFAMAAMGINLIDTENNDTDTSLFKAEKTTYTKLAESMGSDSALVKAYTNVQDIIENIDKKYEEFNSTNDENGKPDIYANNVILTNKSISDEDKKLYQNALYAFRTQLYKAAGDQVYKNAYTNEAGKSSPSDDFDYNKFQYYVSIYNQIQQSNGCVPISDFDDEDSSSNAANNSEWLKAMIECGEITIAMVNNNAEQSDKIFETTSPSSDTAISYTQTTEIDKTALAKAEAEYEHNMKEINKKDEKFDLELSKLETERTALTTEYDSVKKVIEDNIERTFGIFS